MLASHAWLEELIGSRLDPAEVAARLTTAGIEVEAVHEHGVGLENIVIAEVRSMRAHPSRDKLRLVTVFDGMEESEIVCGAPNVPDAGGRVVLAKLGAKLPNGIEIAERSLGGVVSRGMLCGETELGIGADDSGLLVLDASSPAKPGAPIVEALSLRDRTYELSLTPNRADCLGHVGIARELCALLGKPFAAPKPVAAKQIDAKVPVEVQVDDAARCPRYAAGFVEGVTVAASPFWARYRLHVLGQRAISNVVDATNLVLLLWGHPIHGFDAAFLRDSRILVRLAKRGERIKTLDGVERALTDDDLLICDGQGAVALAGVMGGENSEIKPATTRVLIECAYFEPRTVRRTSKRLGMHTDSSHRFERGVDPSAVPAVLAYASALIAQLGGGAVASQVLDVVSKPIMAPRITLRAERIEKMLGMPVEAPEVERILASLGCAVAKSTEGFDVTTPLHRPDLGREIDLIEEVARFIGYDRLPTQLPAIRSSSEGTPARIQLLRKLREAAAGAGLCEAVSYAFVAPKNLEDVRAPASTVTIQNPMTETRSVMRTSLLPGLAQSLVEAQSTQQKSFALFEVARVFLPSAGAELPHEAHQLAILLWGQRPSWYREDEVFDFYDAKSCLEHIVRGVSSRSIETVPDEALEVAAPALHPRRRARVLLGGQAVGALGELHPEVVERLGLVGRPVYALLEVAALESALGSLPALRAQALPRFPASVRDAAVVVPEQVPAGEVEAVLVEAAGPLAERVALFDIYRGEPVAAGHKSLAFHVVYRDPEATLTDRAVDDAHGRVLRAAEARFGASIRR